MATETTEIAREEYYAYERVRQSRMTNMHDVRTVMALTGLDRETVMAIIRRYGELMARHGRPELW